MEFKNGVISILTVDYNGACMVDVLRNALHYHSMAIDNLNKSKETKPTTTSVLKVAPLRTIIHKKIKFPDLSYRSVHKSVETIQGRKLFAEIR